MPIDEALLSLAAPWAWVVDEDGVLARELTFARGVGLPRLIESFGGDPARAVPMSWTAAEEHFSVQGRDFNTPPFWFRGVDLGEWSVILEWGQIYSIEHQVPVLPDTTDTFHVTWTITTQGMFKAVIDGVLEFFDPWGTQAPIGDGPWTFRSLAKPLSSEAHNDARYQAVLLALFARGLGIPDFTLEMARSELPTFWLPG